MNLPEQELFSIEDVAARWGKSVSYVQDLARRRLLPMNRAFIEKISGTTPGRPRFRMKSFVLREDLERFERTDASALKPRISIKEFSFRNDNRSDKQIRRDIKSGKLKAEKIHGRWMISE